VTGQFHGLQVIHAGAAETALAEHETAGLDKLHRHPETGAQPHQGGGVLGNIGLVQGKAHWRFAFPWFMVVTDYTGLGVGSKSGESGGKERGEKYGKEPHIPFLHFSLPWWGVVG